MKYVKMYESYLYEAEEKINIILIPLALDKYRIDTKKDSELGITSSLSDDAVSETLDKKYGKGKWYKKVSVEPAKVNDAKKQLEEDWKAKIASATAVKESYELKQVDGEWAIVGKVSKLFGKKTELEEIIKLIGESEETPKFEVDPVGMEGDVYSLSINGHKYSYKAKPESDLSIQEIGEKFVKILKYSSGRALNWLKKHTVLEKGSAKNESLDMFMVDNIFESNDEIDDRAVDMLDFYGGELPDSWQECDDYAQTRDITDTDLLKEIFMQAQLLQDEDISSDEE